MIDNVENECEFNFMLYAAILSIAAVLIAFSFLLFMPKEKEKPVITENAECFDAMGNLVSGCVETVEKPDECTVEYSLQGNPVVALHLTDSFKKWDRAGRPDDAIDSMRYYLYDSSGKQRVSFYVKTDSSDACWEVPLEESNTKDRYIYTLWINRGGTSYSKNPITGEERSFFKGKSSKDPNMNQAREAAGRIEAGNEWISRCSSYTEEALEAIQSIDYDYFAKLAPGSVTLRHNLPEDKSSPISHSILEEFVSLANSYEVPPSLADRILQSM